MISLTQKERKALLILFKEFTMFYNANSISKVLDMSHVGAQKIFKRLYNNNIIVYQKIGKSIIYKLKIDDDYARELVAFLLVDEANNFKRWKEEFKDLFKEDRIVMLYGSTIKNYKDAKDIDIMIVMNEKDVKEVNKILNEKQKLLPKKLHAIKLTPNDFLKNLKNKNKAIIDIVKNAVILYGQDKYVEIMKNVTSF
jgi:hypothetical protein